MTPTTTINELGRATRCKGRCACLGMCMRGDYVDLKGERIYVRVERGWIVLAEAPPRFGDLFTNWKWRAGEGRIDSLAGRVSYGTDW